MQRQLANGTESLVTADLCGSNSVASDYALMKMGDANQLGDQHQHRAEY